jgi:ABC-type multidrug transport system fused ATPase/permease subunit
VASVANRVPQAVSLPYGQRKPVSASRAKVARSGQRQRIGIARALYKKADVIIFDEATSGLETEAQQAAMQAIDGLSKDLTLLIIAHRLTNLRNCTQIFELGVGGIRLIGSY